jgi:peptidoglycan hydrolase-like protein with peptidoglycan-binding domain
MPTVPQLAIRKPMPRCLKSDAEGAVRNSVRTRRRAAGVVVAVAVVSAAAGWVLASQIRSPAEVAAQTAPPTPSPILVPAEERVVSTDVVTRGTGRFGSIQQLTASPSALKPSPGIVTSIPAPGTQLGEGAVVLTASGRPLFLLAGDRLGVRDLGPGLVGADVQQLEEALQRLGFDPGTVDESYDAATESAVKAWYAAAGFAPFTATDDQLAAIQVAETTLATARVDQDGARDPVATAEGDLAAARASYADALNAQATNASSLNAATAEARAGNVTAAAEVASKQGALGTLLADPSADASAIAAARADLGAAQANLESAQRAGEKTVADANAAAKANDNAVASTAAALHSAEARLASARAVLGDHGRVADLARQDATRARRRAGVQLPADEVLFVPNAPVRVNEVQVKAGDPLGGPVLTVAGATVAIDGSLAIADAPLVKPGTTVQIDEPDLGIKASGVVNQVAGAPGTNGADGFHIWFQVGVDPAPPNLVGASVRLTIPVESSRGAVLAVPTSAVSLTADGSSRVERSSHGTSSFVRVEPGLSADGYVAVTPVSGTLEPGDLVVVGTKESARAGP